MKDDWMILQRDGERLLFTRHASCLYGCSAYACCLHVEKREVNREVQTDMEYPIAARAWRNVHRSSGLRVAQARPAMLSLNSTQHAYATLLQACLLLLPYFLHIHELLIVEIPILLNQFAKERSARY